MAPAGGALPHLRPARRRPHVSSGHHRARCRSRKDGGVRLRRKKKSTKQQDQADEGGEEDSDVSAYVAAIDSDGRLLTQECPVCLSMLGFNALGEFHAAHIIDDYTLLQISRRKTSFRNEFAKSESLLSKANGPAIELFKQKILADTPEAQRSYAAAAAAL